MAAAELDYVPAFGKDFLLPFFDPVVKLFGADRVRGMLLDAAQLQAAHRVLDPGPMSAVAFRVGCTPPCTPATIQQTSSFSSYAMSASKSRITTLRIVCWPD